MSRFRSWRERRRRASALRRINRLRRLVDPLGTARQFIYLDTVALRSLYISRYGPEDARTTISASRTREAEVSGNFGAATPGIGSAHIGGSLRSTVGDATQVERVSSEQSLFRDFIDREAAAGSNAELWDGAAKAPLSPPSLRRGKLLQVRIRLEADVTYRISSFASAMTDLAESAPALNLAVTTEILQVAQVLRQLLIEQAPIDSELVDWKWDPAAKSLVPGSGEGEPIRLVALTQVDSYWLDVRRTLFDRAEYTALVRIVDDAPAHQWSPLKLFDAVKGLPGFRQLEDAIQTLTASLDPSGIVSQPPLLGSLTRALEQYVELLAPGFVDDAVRSEIEAIAASYAPSLPSGSQLTKAFDAVDVVVAISSSDAAAIAPDERAAVRASARANAGVTVSGASTVGSPTPTPVRPEANYLVAEVIAIYW
jgi:hypothetical protein